MSITPEQLAEWRKLASRDYAGIPSLRRATVQVIDALEASRVELVWSSSGNAEGYLSQLLVAYGRRLAGLEAAT